MRPVLQRLVVLLAFAGAFLVPGLARAALLPTCEAYEPVTRIPKEWLPALDEGRAAPTACTHEGDAQAADDGDDGKVPGMCDARGASVVAPPRVHSVGNAWIDVAPGCSGDGIGSAIAPGQQHTPGLGASPALAERGVLDAAIVVPPAPSELGPDFLPIAGGPRAGVPRGVDRPPR